MERSKNVLVIYPFTDEQKQELMQIAPQNRYAFHEDLSTVTAEDVKDADIVLGNPSGGYAKQAEHLEFVQLFSAGSESYVKPGVLKKGTVLANASGAYGAGIGEYLVAMTFALFRNLHLYRDHQSDRLWQGCGPSRLVAGSTFLILGPGDIGGSYAQKIKALGGYTIGVRRTAGEKPEFLDEQYTNEALDDLLPRADVVAMALPSTPQTRHLIDRERLERMKPSAYLINVGRGDAIDLDALYHALRNNQIAGAGLDVFEQEPLPKESPLWGLKNLLITPHNNGGEPIETKDRIAEIILRNYRDFILGNPIQSEVDFQTGYRKSV